MKRFTTGCLSIFLALVFALFAFIALFHALFWQRIPIFPQHYIIHDENMAPLANAELKISYSKITSFLDFDGSVNVTETAKSSKTGRATYTGFASGINRWLSLEVKKEGYYSTTWQYKVGERLPLKILPQYADRFEQPYRILLRRQTTPVVLEGRAAQITLPQLNKDYAYDFRVGDLLPPYGNGHYAHATISATDNLGVRSHLPHFCVHFRAIDDGLIADFDTGFVGLPQPQPAFQLQAPERGYQRSLQRTDDHMVAKFAPGYDPRYHGPYGVTYYLRFSDPSGTFYGVIPEGFDCFRRDPGIKIRFSYWWNPDHSRNLEIHPNSQMQHAALSLPPTIHLQDTDAPKDSHTNGASCR